MLEKILFRIFLIFAKVMQLLPKKFRRFYFLFISRIVYYIAFGTNRIIKANLNLVYPNRFSDEEIKNIQKYSYFNMNLWLLSQIENLIITDEELLEEVQIEGAEIIDRLKERGKPIILISAHYGNMEMLNTYLNRFVTPIIQVARKSNFTEIDKFIVKSREKSGATIVFRDGAVKKLVKALMNKDVVSLIVDQKINHKDGVEVEFLGKRANQTRTPATLSRKFEACVVPIAIFNQDDFTYKIKIYNPIKPIKTENEEEDLKAMTQLHANALSDIINTDPKQWFWPHKRFKNYYKEIYEKNSNN